MFKKSALGVSELDSHLLLNRNCCF